MPLSLLPSWRLRLPLLFLLFCCLAVLLPVRHCCRVGAFAGLALAAAAMFLLCCFRVGACREEVEEHVGDVSPIASTDSLLLAQDGCRVGAVAGFALAAAARFALARLALLPGWPFCQVVTVARLALAAVARFLLCCCRVGAVAGYVLLPGRKKWKSM